MNKSFFEHSEILKESKERWLNDLKKIEKGKLSPERCLVMIEADVHELLHIQKKQIKKIIGWTPTTKKLKRIQSIKYA